MRCIRPLSNTYPPTPNLHERTGKNIFVETHYAGVNVGAILTYKGLIAVDVPTFPREARDWAIRLHRLNQYPLQFVILTDYSGDRTLNTRWLSAPP